MNVFESIKSKSIDELTEWLDKYCVFGNAPWIEYWDKTYCNKCDAVYYDGDRNEYAWCELNNRCKFFQDMSSIPNDKQIIKMWLESEIE